MRALSTLVGYVAVVAVLVSGLMGGVFWLVRPDPSLSEPARVAAIPPRIAESIERKAPIPVAAPEPVPERASMPNPAPMREQNVSLTLPPPVTIRELSAPPPAKKTKRAKPGERPTTAVAESAPVPAEAPVPRPAVSTARSDVPY
jgi:hypothetical protein